jgi:2-polyprenyl-3-methyl-5-hydroxy-6-metoxy-1,4-benzoquinol methylase
VPESQLNLKVLEDHYQEEEYGGFKDDPYFAQVVRGEIESTFRQHAPQAKQILDVGCGNGSFLAVAKDAGYSVYGVDISHAAVKHCAERGIEASAGDFLTMPIKEGAEIITMWDLVEHLPHPETFCKRAFELLAPGGYLLIKTPRMLGTAFTLSRMHPMFAKIILSVPFHITFFSTKSMEKMLKSLGYDSIIWLPSRRMRQRRKPKNLRSLVGYVVRVLAERTGGSGNHYLLAHKGAGA